MGPCTLQTMPKLVVYRSTHYIMFWNLDDVQLCTILHVKHNGILTEVRVSVQYMNT